MADAQLFGPLGEAQGLAVERDELRRLVPRPAEALAAPLGDRS